MRLYTVRECSRRSEEQGQDHISSRYSAGRVHVARITCCEADRAISGAATTASHAFSVNSRWLICDKGVPKMWLPESRAPPDTRSYKRREATQ